MPFTEVSRVESRQEFVALAQQPDANIRALCRRFGIGAKTGYRWLARAAASEPLTDRSRRPHTSPQRTAPLLEAAVVALRQQHPTWGGRTLKTVLEREFASVPAAATITDILRRHGLLAPLDRPHRAYGSFCAPHPNALWQMDFMGHRALAAGRVHPFTVLDDHSRFALALEACGDQRRTTVQTHLTACFRRFGLPETLLCDNGPPWGSSGRGGMTAIEAWLIRLGIDVWHGRPRHPQTQGKIERFHRTVGHTCFPTTRPPMPTLADAATAFATMRHTYNHERPHHALAMAVPAARYTMSPRPFPETLPDLVYDEDDERRLVRAQGAISYRGRSIFVSRGLIGQPVALRPTTTDGIIEVRFAHRLIQVIDLHQPLDPVAD